MEIYPTNFPKLVSVLEHAKDHVKAEITSTKTNYRMGGQTIEETFTDPLEKDPVHRPEDQYNNRKEDSNQI